MKYGLLLVSAAIALGLAVQSQAAMDTPVASKEDATYTVEDMSIYWLRNLGKDALISFFQAMVVYQEGVKQGLKPTTQEISDFVAKEMGQDVYDSFKQLYSERAVQQMIDYTIVGRKYEKWARDKIRAEQNITVTEKEASDYFLKNIDQFHLPEGVYLSLISVDNTNQADAVLKRLKGGESFNDVAAEVNMDPQMRAQRGEIGVYRKGDGLPEPLEKAAFALKDGQYSDVIKGQNYHIVYCHKHYPEVSPSFDEVKEQLMSDLVEAKIDPFYQKQLGDLWDREMPKFKILAELFRPAEEASPAAAPAAAPAPAPARVK